MIEKKFIEELKKHGDPKRAVFHQNYNKSKRTHWGVTVPQCNKLAIEFSKDLNEPEMLRLA